MKREAYEFFQLLELSKMLYHIDKNTFSLLARENFQSQLCFLAEICTTSADLQFRKLLDMPVLLALPFSRYLSDFSVFFSRN